MNTNLFGRTDDENTLSNTYNNAFNSSADDNENDDLKEQYILDIPSSPTTSNINSASNSNRISNQSKIESDLKTEEDEYEKDINDERERTRKEQMQADIEFLQIVYINEKLSPEILQFQEETVGCIKEYIKQREDEIDSITDGISNFNQNVLQSMEIWWKMELKRISFLLQGYLRVRIWKIQKYAFYISSTSEAYANLSENEKTFVTNYCNLNEKYFLQFFMKEFPTDELRDLVDEKTAMIIEPNLNAYLVMKVIEETMGFVINEYTEPLNLMQGDILVGNYSDFRNLIENGSLDLI